MATSTSWIRAYNELTKSGLPEPTKTIETYSNIKEMGLETVLWLYLEDLNMIELGKVREFIRGNKPCLFIYDPKKDGLEKGYLFNVLHFLEVMNWLSDNNSDDYSFLVTSQITNPGDGFVGNVFSNGEGRIFCESLHKPGVCNHRDLVRVKSEDVQYLSQFATENFDLLAIKNNLLSLKDINGLISIYGKRKGYFEFVKGFQSGGAGIYTTGFSPLMFLTSFPEELYTMLCINIRNRWNARMMR